MLQLKESDFRGKLGSFYAYLKTDEPLIDNYQSRVLAKITLDSGEEVSAHLLVQLSRKPEESETQQWEYSLVI